MSFLDRREFVKAGLATSAAATFSLSRAQATGPNDEINLGFISCGGQAGGLMGSFSGVKGVHIGGLCDPDQGRLDSAGKRFPKAKKWQDLRHLLEDSSIDAVVIATCNHWHCLAAIWAMQAGKDVYVEKPLSHSQWEGRQTVAAARKYDRICQLGTQQRSDPMQTAIKKFLHQDKALGAIQGTRVNRYGVRGSIGKRSAALGINSEVDYNLWLGPAQRKPIFRNKLHYDWHWDWNTGSGEMGNWGVHVLDDVRNNVFQDQVLLPKRIVRGGGRVVWDDAGESPNVHFVQFDTGNIPVVIGLSNLTDGPGKRGSAPHPGPRAIASKFHPNSSFSRNLVSHAASFLFCLKLDFEVSCLSKVVTKRRRKLMFSAAWPLRMRLQSSPNTTSITQCKLFSMPQWLRTLSLNRRTFDSRLAMK